MNKQFSIVNGDLVPKEIASVLASDLAVQRGYGIFDFFRTQDFQPLYLEDHLDRLFHSAGKMRLDTTLKREEVKEMILQLNEKNGLSDSGIRVTVTGGPSPDGYHIEKPNLIITQNAFSVNEGNFYKGYKLVTYEHQRQLPTVKTIDYLMAIYLQDWVRGQKADDVLYYSNGGIRECPRANFFIIDKNNRVVTPVKDVLFGITRKHIVALRDFDIHESEISLADLSEAKEAFVTSSTKRVLPVTEIDGKAVGNGLPGQISMAINEKLKSL